MLCELFWWDWFCIMEDLVFFYEELMTCSIFSRHPVEATSAFTEAGGWFPPPHSFYLVMMCVHVGACMYSHPQTGCRMKLQSSESPGQNTGSGVQSDLKSYLLPDFIAWITQPEEIKNVFVSVWAFSFSGVKELCIIYRHSWYRRTKRFFYGSFWEEKKNRNKNVEVALWVCDSHHTLEFYTVMSVWGGTVENLIQTQITDSTLEVNNEIWTFIAQGIFKKQQNY